MISTFVSCRPSAFLSPGWRKVTLCNVPSVVFSFLALPSPLRGQEPSLFSCSNCSTDLHVVLFFALFPHPSPALPVFSSRYPPGAVAIRDRGRVRREVCVSSESRHRNIPLNGPIPCGIERLNVYQWSAWYHQIFLTWDVYVSFNEVQNRPRDPPVVKHYHKRDAFPCVCLPF